MTQDQNDDSLFTVATGEVATVSLQSVQCLCKTKADFDSQKLDQQRTEPDVYSFAVTGNSGDEKVFAALCQFMDGDPTSAHYTIAVQGNQGGAFTSSSIFKETPEASFQLFFNIA